uniref:Uncharacterized protein n=1 Tax=uncultured Thiotrichaceae bacterium TaxID=298394 RepID=A0A6S6UK81_9GAMM|nr:MAG: Unknown protein [uncultured Thiotrichaceae bacterium]
MNITCIALKKFDAIVYDTAAISATNDDNNTAQVLTLNAHLISQGFILAEDLFNTLNRVSPQALAELAHVLMPAVQELKGSHLNNLSG